MEWSDLLQPLLETIITVFAPILLGALAFWLRGLITKTKAELSVEELRFLTNLADRFVLAAEQSGLTGKIQNVGESKKRMVLALLQEEAKKRGIKIDVSILSALVEASVVDAFGLSDENPALPEEVG